jgi:hypothetical protein
MVGCQSISGDAVIRSKTEDSEIVVTTTSRCAGAIHSLTWRGREFLDSFDHGRQMQSASNFDAGSTITSETFNPTEAGSLQDGVGASSTSRLLSLRAQSNQLETKSQMAFWLPPGGKSGQNFAKNLTALSNHILTKKVVIGAQGRPHLISYDVTFELPKDERHEYAVFESLTGYMPPEFSEFRILDAKTKELKPLSDGPGEQSHPIIFCTPDGNYAIGIYSSERQAKGYGRWRFSAEKVVKWNCVFRVQHPKPGGKFSFKHYVAVGTLDIVKKELERLIVES